MNQPFKILFKYPCRGREKSFFESLDSLNNNIRDRNNYHINITIDTDDTILNNESVLNAISLYPNTSVTFGISESKVHAINRDMPMDYDWDVIIAWSNDMVATFYGFDDIFRENIHHAHNKTGELDFLVHFPDLDAREQLNVLYIATRKYYDRFGYIYHPSYKSLWCDNESMAVAKLLDKHHYFGIPNLFEHRNPAYHQYNVPRDDLFNKQQAMWAIDEANFHKRKAINFGLKDEEIINSFLLSNHFPYT